ncbi:MAG: gamma-butyrobetaine hydroxylase-like domain-containing protein [Acidimicrobiia bacterium]
MKILNVAFVGAYAINLTFSPDGHTTGIYPYDLLRDLGKTSRLK